MGKGCYPLTHTEKNRRMSKYLHLISHPRLFAGVEQIARLKSRPDLEWLQGIEDWVREHAEKWVDAPSFVDPDKSEFCYCIIPGKEHEMRVTSLAIRWLQTGEERYRRSVVEYVRWMNESDCWSEIFRGRRPDDPTRDYDLNHGVRALTLALAYDWLYDSLLPDEKALFLEVAKTYIFDTAIKNCRDGGSWWYATAHNNWNGVCAGGLGVLCLAMYDDCAEARELLPRVEHSLGIFMRAHAENSGASEEGTGYWNYGMRYAGLYLRSYEMATGEKHLLLEVPWLEANLTFPLDFSPNGLDVGFGDIPGFGQPLPFHYDIARSRGLDKVVRRIDARLRKNPRPVPSTNTGTGMGYWDAWESATPLWLLVHDRNETAPPAVDKHGVKIYPGLDWGLLADSMPHSHLYMSVRGGNAGAAHAHDDLLSFNCCVGHEILIGNPKPSKYLPTTFTLRRCEIPDINPQFKNTLLINGVGMYHGTRTDSVLVIEGRGYKGIRMAATSAFTTPAGATHPRNISRLDFVGRLFLMLDHGAWLIVDSISSPKGGPSLCEARFHTYAHTERTENGALLTGKRESLRMSFAANVRSFLATATTAPTTARDTVATMLRWCADEHVRELKPRVTFLVTLLTPGRCDSELDLKVKENVANIRTRFNNKRRAFHLDQDLKIIE